MNVAVVGVGKLGVCLAAVLAEAGHTVHCVDTDAKVLLDISQGIAPVDEPHLQGRMMDNGLRMQPSSLSEAVRASLVVFVVVPTPSDDSGAFDNRHVVKTVAAIGHSLTLNQVVTVVIVSTVMPGSTTGEISSALNAAASRTVPIVYSPLFVALGSVIHDLHHPDVVLIGSENVAASMIVEDVLRSFVVDAQWFCLSTIDAEIAKLATNCALSVKIALANEIAMLCDQTPGADARLVLTAVGADSRIGSKFLSPGGPASGPCLPRDLRAMIELQRSRQSPSSLPLAVLALNEQQLVRVAEQLVHMANGGDILILGGTYKAGSYICDDAPGVRVAEILRRMKRDGYAAFGILHIEQSPVRGKRPSGVAVLLAAPWSEFLRYDFSECCVLDLWGALPPADNVHRFGLGVPSLPQLGEPA